MPVYKYTLKDGKSVRWYANFYITDWTGNRKHICKRGFLTQREAKEYEKSFFEINNGTSDMAFTEMLNMYFAEMRKELKISTISNKEYVINTKILPYFKDLKINEITSKTILAWQNEMKSYRKPDGKPYSETYLKGLNNQLSAIMNFAVNHCGLNKNPCRAAGSMGKAKAEEMSIWTKEEFEYALTFESRQDYHLAYEVLFYTGIRAGELLALTPDTVLPTKELNIVQNFSRIKNNSYLLTPKTSRSKRKVSLPDFLYNNLQEYIRLLKLQGDDRLFVMSKSRLLSSLKRLAGFAGLREIRVHDLRHSHASMLINMKVPLLEISRRLGHESLNTTVDTYGHIYPEREQELADMLDGLKK